ncbi:hypothetical protein [uncultured Paracoccus sp.]|uniref:hypothetical protein n=1 Tax=uncultured Paracoccus sp. TaxID=189685 RepID=UPI00261DCC4C|nr:hypothetical protein [uncultured Paracoccus sp.]
MSSLSHLTTRRGFVAALGFGGVSLYGLWVGYGAAPGPAALFRSAEGADDQLAAHGGGGHGAVTAGPDAEAFRTEVENFIARFGQADGSVYPRHEALAAMETAAPATIMAAHAPDPAAAAGHGHDDGHAGQSEATPSDDHAEPLNIPMIAERWFYEPAHLRLDARTPYRFRLMATDIPHGASIQFGRGSRMIRLRPGTVTEVDLTFEKPGSYLVYCTAYCGTGHDAMQARVDVV